VNRYLRIRLGTSEPADIDCAGPRPRATTPAEIATAINTALPGLAFTDEKSVTLVEPTSGADSRIELEPPRQRDALDLVLGVEPGLTRGAAPGGIRFTGTVDLSGGVDLPADAAIRLAVDGSAAIDLALGDGATPSRHSLSQLVGAINVALVAQLAAHDGVHLLLTSPSVGAGSRLEILPPTSGTDVAGLLFGITAPRTYAGAPALPARVIGTVDRTSPVDLSVANLLTLAVDGGAAVTVDLTSAADDPAAVTASQLATAINAATTANASTVAVPGGLAVRISSPSTGLSSRIELRRSGAGDAAPLLFGTTRFATGIAPRPATLDGTVDLLAPVDLSERSVLRLAVDGEPPFEVDVAGATATTTVAGEIVAAINEAVPGLAGLSPEDSLRLTSPTQGPDSVVEVVPLRFLELTEYPPRPASATGPVAHGTVLRFRNTGASAVPGRVLLTTASGVSEPRIADPVAGWSIRVREAIGAGGSLTLELADDGTVKAVVTENGSSRPAAQVETTGADLLLVRRGLNAWSWSECRAARFDAATFDVDRFAGGGDSEDAVFDLSSFGPQTGRPAAVFAASGARRPVAELRVEWDSHQAGAFVVNLPAELDRRFGFAFGAGGRGVAAIGEGRFGTATPELHAAVVTEPAGDEQFLVDRLNDLQTGSKLVVARLVDLVPIGWSAVALPFRNPAHLTGGRPGAQARLFLSEPGLTPAFVELAATDEGAWGNDIIVTARAAGPAIYDLEVAFPGGRFESARQAVAGPPLPSLADALLRPGPVGVCLAKAAGIHADVTRDRVAGPDQTEENP
ncbi:MAG TPA: hypothetical protein VFT31_10430, partial [Kribbella sp.]|nr:hypothetical protein [Kribbella sp.]